MCRPLPPTKILHYPQCIKAKINSSINGRSYLKHLIFFFFFEISFTPANVSSQKKNNNKTKKKKHKQKQKQKAKRKEKKKQIEKEIKTNVVQLHKVLLEFTWHPNRQGSPVT